MIKNFSLTYKGFFRSKSTILQKNSENKNPGNPGIFVLN